MKVGYLFASNKTEQLFFIFQVFHELGFVLKPNFLYFSGFS
jgi:ssDNA-specific exonuclease RecJ